MPLQTFPCRLVSRFSPGGCCGSSVVCYFSYLDRYSIIQVKRLCKLIISMFISKVKLM